MNQSRMMKVGRNDPCPCGSGLKYKKCCLTGSPRDRLLQDVIQRANAIQAVEQARLEKYGEVKPIIHEEFHGHRFVMVGNEIHYQPLNTCQTFPDFLKNHLAIVLGQEWGKAELEKPYDEMHPVIQWYSARSAYMRTQVPDEKGLIAVPARGPALAILQLAYDLYTIHHNAELRDELLRRIRLRDSFQGACYEAFATATFVRAGFDITFEDERDPSSKHPEFVATHRSTGQKLALEAKSKHRAGILGHRGSNKQIDPLAPDVRRLLNKALQKAPDHPYVVFIDLNLPSDSRPTNEQVWYPELERLAYRLAECQDGKPAAFAQLVFTNFPHPYVAIEGEEQLPGQMYGVAAKIPNIPLQHPECLLSIPRGLQQCEIPLEFPVRENN